MRVAIMGAGAVGSYFGAKLARAGADVIFIGRGDHLDRIRRYGLDVKSVNGDFQVFAVTALRPADVGECDLVLFTVKTYDTEEAMEAMEPLVGPNTTILPLQNGVESEEKLIARFGEERVIGGLCYVGAAIEKPGQVVHSAAGKIIMGELDGRITIRAATVENWFAEADVELKISSEIMADKWKKLAWNVSFNAISALTRQTVGKILDTVETREMVRATVAETVAVAHARDIDLDLYLPDRIIEDNRVYANLRTSMLRDAERGGRLEYEALNGVVVRYGAMAGVETPVNGMLYGMLKCMSE